MPYHALGMTNPNIYGGVELPDEKKYLEAIRETRELEGIDSPDSMDDAIDRAMARRPRFVRLMQLAKAVGTIVEHVDRSTLSYADENHATAIATIHGMAFGGLMIPNVHGSIVSPDAFDGMPPISIPEDSKDFLQEKQELAGRWLEYGGIGLADMGKPAQDELEELEGKVVISGDPLIQRKFRFGCGIVAHAALDAHIAYNERKAAQDRLQLANMLNSQQEIDWDISKLLGE